MKAVLLLVSTILFTLAAARTELEYQSAWNDFVAKYNKSYSCPMETVNRYIIFKNNLDFVENFNNGPERTFQVAINKFADLTNTEFAAMYNGFLMDAKKTNSPFVYAGKAAPPSSWDWRTKGAVTPIKDQGQCGSCWAFSAVGSMEGCHFLTTGSLVSLSEQDLVDCSGNEGNDGCDGGLMDDAFQYVMDNKGIDKESCYPYNAEDGTCHYTASCCGSTVTSFSDVTPAGDESALLTAVYSAPTSVAIDASQSSFQLYSSGVYYEPDCSSQQLDHGVLAVGYGSSSGQDYWIVKNSWGVDWGMSGYIWMSRNKSNNCGIATMASLPHGCGNCK